MTWARRSNEKRIAELEKRTGIIPDYQQIDYWKELNEYAARAFRKEGPDKPAYTFTLPDYLMFAREIFLRIIEFYKKLYKKVLNKKYTTPAEHIGKWKILLKGFGWIVTEDYGEAKTAYLIRTLPMLEELKEFFLSFISEYPLEVSERIISSESRRKMIYTWV